jgi:hypothetical protein
MKMNTKSELNSVKKLVLQVLEQYPETRNSDNKLYIQCAKELGAKTLDDLLNIKLNIITLHKTRQVIQNKFGMYLPDKEVAKARYERQLEFRDWIIE